MAAYTCPRCKHTRSRAKLQLCNVCWLLDSLIEEHEQGLHAGRVNVSCLACRPAHDRRLREGGQTAYVQRVLAARPLNVKLAKFLLRLDREGLPAAVQQGPTGSRALIWLRDHGHVRLTDRDVFVYAQSRFKALEIVATNVTPETRSERPTPAAGRVQSTSHAACDHEATPAARAKCRAARRG